MAITSIISYSLLIISISVATNGAVVDNVCRETKYPQLCLAALGGPASRSSNFRGLGMAGLQTLAKCAILSETKFQHLLVSSPRPDLKPHYSRCEKIYEEISETSTATLQAARLGRWDQVAPNVSPVIGLVDQCEDLFTGTSPVHSLSDNARVAAQAVLVIAKALAK